MTLEDLGFGEYFSAAFAALGFDGAVPGRVVRQGAFICRVQTEDGEVDCEVAGRARAAGPPAVGDWVALRPSSGKGSALILAVLPRRSSFSRGAAGRAVAEQVVAANIDDVFIVTDLGRDLNLRRLERAITLVYNSGADPAVILNKTDLAGDVEGAVTRTQDSCPGVAVISMNAGDQGDIERLRDRIVPGRTCAFIGSSGVGKSTIINRLLGEDRMAVGGVRESDGKGRHTTTHRELVVLPGGGAVIDTPGMREIGVWGDEEGLSGTFPEIEELASRCRFRDCRHEGEKGCAVVDAAASGAVDAGRLDSYRKLRAEFENLHARKDQHARMHERREGRKFTRMVREMERLHPKRKR